MNQLLKSNDVSVLNKELMKLMSAMDQKALDVIAKLMELGVEKKDNALIGYAYYRYAYYYYFTVQNMPEFRENVTQAIKYLLRSEDKEFLAGSYNLIAYDAQDQGSYDVAYAYFMLAVRTSEHLEGIALPGLIEASAARLLIELGEYETAMEQEKSSIKRTKKFTDMHVYNYNMILSYADVAMCAFKLGDIDELRAAREQIEEHYEAADNEERLLSKTYYLLAHIYENLMLGRRDEMSATLDELLTHWTNMNASELLGVIYEIETLCEYMMEHGYLDEVSRILEVTRVIDSDENFAIVMRYNAVRIAFYEKTKDMAKLREALLNQHRYQKIQSAEAKSMIKYSMDFSNTIEAISRDREAATEENLILQRQANTDILTGLPNRYALTAYLQDKCYEAEEKSQNFAVGILDVDNFKLYNDTFGHGAGDECLKLIGSILLEYNSDPDIFCTRYGGDEFVIGYFNLSDERIEELRDEMAERIHLESSKNLLGSVEVSQGIFNRVPDESFRLWDYLTQADRELYAIKRIN